MPVENRQIASGAITDTKVSKNAGIKGSKLEVAEPGQILVADEKGRFQPKHVDFDKCCDNKIPDDVLRGGDLEDGQIYVGGRDGVPTQIPAVPSPETIVRKDPGTGTVTDPVPADKVEDGDTTPIEGPGNEAGNPDLGVNLGTDGSDLNATPLDVATQQPLGAKQLIFVTPANTQAKAFTFKHNMGFRPNIQIVDNSTQQEMDAEVTLGTQEATVRVSDTGTQLMVIFT